MTASTPSRPADRAPGSLLLWTLLAAMGAGPVFNYAVSTSSTVIIDRLGVTSGQLGTVMTVVFAAAAVTSVGLGRAADRLSSRTQMAIIFFGSALALAVGGFAGSLWALYGAAVLAGVTQTISNPTTNRIIRTSVPEERRIGWIGVKQSGVQASQLFAGLFFPVAALGLGWTGASLVAAALVGLLGVVALRAAPPLPGAPAAPPTTTPDAGRPRTGRARTPLPATVWFFAGIAFLTGFGMQATNMYLPLFAVESLGQTLVIGGAAAATSGVIGVFSRIWWSRRMAAGHRPTTLLAGIALGAVVGVVVFLGADLLHAPALLWVGAAVHGLTVLGTNVVTNAGLMDAVPSHHLGRASGVNAMGMYAGFACGPLVMGLMRDLTGDFRVGFLAVGVFYLLALAVVGLLRRHTDRHGAPRAA
ncbi:MFS transporter [Micrococcus porci]|uniref:MFS transporter n=1 Tax=Micrococcus porci TaxID=2856555 RepID=UPI003CF1352B